MTAPTPQTTPTRDEAVRKTTERLRYTASINARRFDDDHPLVGELREAADLIEALASAPAPASGGVEQNEKGPADFSTGPLRDHDPVATAATPVSEDSEPSSYSTTTDRAKPTPVSEAGGDAWPAQSGGLNADWVAMVLAEDARIEDGKLANGPYLAVKIAEAADMPAEVSRLRKALAHVRDHTRETSTATMAIGALTKPASSPAGGDEIARWKRDSELLSAIQNECWDVRFTNSPNADAGDYTVNIEIVGHFMADPQERIVGENYNEDLRAALEQAMTAEPYPPARPIYDEPDEPEDAALSQSTSPAESPTASGETVGSFRDRGPGATNPPGRGGLGQDSTSGEVGK